MKLEFKSEDFKDIVGTKSIAIWCNGEIAKAMKEWRKSWVRVYSKNLGLWDVLHLDGSTDQAYLVEIEPVEKKECKHLITVHVGTETSGTWYECRKCDKKLKAQWSVIE